MGWFSKPPEPEESEPQPVRLASDEFISGLREIAELYDRREKQARASILIRAEELSRKEFFNYRELEDQYIGQIRNSVLDALQWQQLAAEVRNWINQYLTRGREPPYMAAPARIKPRIRPGNDLRMTPPW